MAVSSQLNTALAGVVASAMTVAANSPTIPAVTPDNKGQLVAALTTALTNDPTVQNANDATMPTPWYMSAVLMGSLVSLFCSILASLWGVQVAPETQQAIINALPGIIGAVGSVVAIVARFRTSAKPLTR